MGFILDVWSILVLIALILVLGAGLWTLIPRWHSVPPTPSRPRWIRRALQLADTQPGEQVYDLGAGDGRVLLIAAREFGARGVGYEVEPLHCALAWLRALLGGLSRRVSIRCRDMYQADLRQADVVFLYLNPRLVAALQPLLSRQLRPGARVVSLDFPFDDWEPYAVDIGYLVFCYHMPPQEGTVDDYMRKHLTPAADGDIMGSVPG